MPKKKQKIAPKTDESALIEVIQQASTLHQNKNYDDARKLYQKALKMMPNEPRILNMIGRLELDAGNYDVARIRLEKALKIQSNSDIYANLGDLYFELEDFEKAHEIFSKALSINPNDSRSWITVGICLMNLQKHKQASRALQTSITIAPSSKAYYQISHLAYILGDTDSCRENAKKAIALDENNADAFMKLALCELVDNNFSQALTLGVLAVQKSGKSHELVFELRGILSHFPQRSYYPLLKEAITICLEDKNLDHSNLTGIWSFSCIGDTSTNAFIQFYQKEDQYRKDKLQDNIEKFASVLLDPFFVNGMKNIGGSGSYMEESLRNFRKDLLMRQNELTDTQGQSNLDIIALWTERCFLNEYVFLEDDEESEKLDALEKEIMLSFSTVNTEFWYKLLIYGAYRPLAKLENISKLLKVDNKQKSIQAVLKSQIAAPLEEEKIKKTIKTFGTIKDTISQKVQEQYEENPYPRWKTITKDYLFSPEDAVLKKWHENSSKSEKETILIAGCGTGRHSLGVALRHPQLNVLAVDLSSSSLAYAIRKTRETGLQNIRYIQADILDLDRLNKKFDWIESSGVLHHMKDPMAGWSVLTRLLSDRGVMNIGLYSELARQGIVKLRNIIEEKNYPATQRGIWELREYIKANYKSDPLFHQVLGFRDFYSTSMCRDLLFHVQEHRFTIAKIKQSLHELDLEFAGFQVSDPRVFRKYSDQFPEDKNFRNLDNFMQFEEENPNTFSGMYQFFIKKKQR